MAGTEQHPQIKVYAKNHQVGSLIFEQPRFCQLRYSQHWLETGYAISPHLPLSGQFNSQTTENFIRNITAFDLLSLADDAGIKFDVLKRRLERLATVCRNLSQRLDFSDEGLSKQQLAITKALAQLVDSRCDALLEQSRQFKAVILSAFS